MTSPKCTVLALTVVALSALVFVACSSPPPPKQPAPSGVEQQRIVDRAADVFTQMRSSPRLGPRMSELFDRAQAVVVFPRLVKASVVFGGEGGNGVMVVRRGDGSFSPPAFYSLGAASAGLQVGYQETSAVFFIMRRRAVELAVNSQFRLGGDASVAAGYVGSGGKGVSGVVSDDVYTFTEVGGAFVGVSFEGHVMGSRPRHNHAYYGREVTSREILFGTEGGAALVVPPGARVLAEALGSAASPPGPPGKVDGEAGEAVDESAGEAGQAADESAGEAGQAADESAGEPAD
jgi:SH3 domain-containing YSC84-like protein 1